MPPKKNQKKSSNQASKATSKVASKVSTPQPPGTPIESALPLKKLGTIVVGINFGQTASSIALINKDGTADCIANDDGERQIPSVISFSGTQTYVGNPARLQLIRNQANTVVGFRNLLGKTYEEVKLIKPLYNSAKIINKDGEPAYLIKHDQDESTDQTTKEEILTVTEITTKYLETLVKYAQDFVGRKPDAAVFSTPDSFTPDQTKALKSIAEDKLGIKVLQFVSAAGSTVVASNLGNPKSTKKPYQDINLVVLDIGGTSTTASVLSCRSGLVLPLATCTDSNLGGNHFEDQMMDFFVKEFNKKNKTKLDLNDDANHKSAIKLRLATEIAKKTLSASNSANCSVDSLFDGYDFSGSINRMRCDLLLSKLYSRIINLVTEAITKSGLNKEEIDEVALTGGSSKLPAIAEKLTYAIHPNVAIDNTIEPDEVIAIGCVVQADLIVKRYPLDSSKFDAEFPKTLRSDCSTAQCLTKPLGLLLPASDPTAPSSFDGKQFLTLVHANTPLPIQMSFILPPIKKGKTSSIPIDLWQGESMIKIEETQTKDQVKIDEEEDEDDDDDDEPERFCVIKPESCIAHLDLNEVTENDKLLISIKIENLLGNFKIGFGGPQNDQQSIETQFKI